MAENLIHQLIPHQGCVISRTVDGIDIAGSAMNWVMSAGVVPFACRAPFAFRVVGRTDSTNLRMHWHRGEVIFNWECSVRELRVRVGRRGFRTQVFVVVTTLLDARLYSAHDLADLYGQRWHCEVFQSQDIKFTRGAFFFLVGCNRRFFKGQHVVHFDRPIGMHHDLFHQELDHCLTVLIA